PAKNGAQASGSLSASFRFLVLSALECYCYSATSGSIRPEACSTATPRSLRAPHPPLHVSERPHSPDATVPRNHTTCTAASRHSEPITRTHYHSPGKHSQTAALHPNSYNCNPTRILHNIRRFRKRSPTASNCDSIYRISSPRQRPALLPAKSPLVVTSLAFTRFLHIS